MSLPTSQRSEMRGTRFRAKRRLLFRGPGEAVGGFGGGDQARGFPGGEVDLCDLVGPVAGGVGDFVVGVDEELLWGGGDIDGVGDGEGLEVDDDDLLGGHAVDEEPAAVGGGGGAVTGAGQRDPL